VRTGRSIIARGQGGGRGDVPMLLQFIGGALSGLGYIILLPFIGLVGCILLIAYRIKQGLAAIKVQLLSR